MSRWTFWILVALTVAITAGTASATDPADVPPWRWKEPGCFAFSEVRQAYACIAFDAFPSDDLESTERMLTQRFDDSVETARSVASQISLGVAIVKSLDPDDADWGDPATVWREIDMPFADHDRTLVDKAALRTLLADGQFETVPPRTLLPAGDWVKVRGLRYRYTVDLHEGDASYEYNGLLEVRCSASADPIDVFPKAGVRGPLAMMSAASGTTLRVLTIEVHDGGEGYNDVQHEHMMFDAAALCSK